MSFDMQKDNKKQESRGPKAHLVINSQLDIWISARHMRPNTPSKSDVLCLKGSEESYWTGQLCPTSWDLLWFPLLFATLPTTTVLTFHQWHMLLLYRVMWYSSCHQHNIYWLLIGQRCHAGHTSNRGFTKFACQIWQICQICWIDYIKEN